jgi:hypothetical protein
MARLSLECVPMNISHALLASLTLSLFAPTIGGCTAPTEEAAESSDDIGEVTFRTVKETRQISTVDGPILFDTSVVRARTASVALDAEVNARLTAMVDEVARAAAKPETLHEDTVIVQAVALNYAGLVTITQTVTFPARGRGSRSAVTLDLRKTHGALQAASSKYVNAEGAKLLSDRCVKQVCMSWLESSGVRVYSRAHDGSAEASSVVPYSLLSGMLVDGRLKRLAGESVPR